MHLSRIQPEVGDHRGVTRIFVVGDSHIHAIKEAVGLRASDGREVRIEARRLFKLKQLAEPVADRGRAPRPGIVAAVLNQIRRKAPAANQALVGDISMEQALKIARKLRPDDILVSAIGGNQHAVFSTIRHPQPFDFMLPGGETTDAPAADAELVPFRALFEYFRSSLRKGDGATIELLRKSTCARVIHLLSPPPKRENAWIEKHHDTFFASDGIAHHGVSEPELRMKFWHLHNLALQEICAELDVELLGPPEEACDADGFLRREFYAGDATHANVRYGELVLRQLDARAAEDDHRAMRA